jgi:O-antigen/teichoic acid export membrane protein
MLLLGVLACAFFAPAVVGGSVLLPSDNLLLLPPWSDVAQQLQPGFVTPHNRLISDLILQNYGWKGYLAESLRRHELPLWNPYLQAGTPFLASGQYGVMYPLGLLFVFLPVERAYGYFAALHVFIAGSGVYWFSRVHGNGRTASLLAGVTFMFAQRLITSAVWPQMLSAMAWMGWIFLWMELALRDGAAKKTVGAEYGPLRAIVICCLGAVTVALQILCGHLEISFYVLFTAILYGVLRLGADLFDHMRSRSLTRDTGRALLGSTIRLALLGLGGLGLAAAQLVPFSEAIGQNFREGSVTFQEISGWAMPARQLVAFVVPDVYGNPSQHDYFDIFTRQQRAIGPNSTGQPTDPPQTVSWGTKDYVEGASYLGVLPLLLAVVAFIRRWRTRQVMLFGMIGVVSLLLATGSPLYKPLFLYVPGFSQIHSAFRWVYIYGFAVAMLAASGLDALVCPATLVSNRSRMFQRSLGWLAVVTSVGAIVSIVAGYVLRERFALRLEESIAHNALLAQNFSDGREFYAILYGHVARFLVLLAPGVLLVGAGLMSHRARASVGVLAVALVVADLFIASAGFNSATNTTVLRYTPPIVDFLQHAPGPGRIVSYKRDDLLNADTAMIWRLEDVRGYDTIVLRRYADFMNLVEAQTMLLPYSRVKGLDDPRSLKNPLINVLNVRYILTTEELPGPQFVPRFEDHGGIRVYENRDVLPRAFIVHQARWVTNASDALAGMKAPGFDPATTVILEGTDDHVIQPGSGGEATVLESAPQRVTLRATLPAPGYLILSDVYFPGWEATVDGAPQRVLVADEAFRAVALPAGGHDVVFRYRPQSFRTGLLISGFALAILLLSLLVGLWSWLGARVRTRDSAAGRIAKNALTLMGASLWNKVLDFALIIWATSVVGPEGIGKYYFAVAVIGFLGTVGDYGLVTLTLREVARDRDQATRYYVNLILIRWLVAIPLLGVIWLITAPLATSLRLTSDTATVLWLLIACFFPGAIASSGSAILKAFERMEYTAFLDVAGNLLRIGLSVAFLLSGWNVVGLAVAAMVVNMFNAAAYTAFARPLIRWRSLQLDLPFCHWAIVESTPLMVNQLLNIFFFRVDVLLLKPLTSDLVVGYYGIAYKFIDGLGFLSAYLTQALFPTLARSATTDRAAARTTTIFGLRVLLLLALPLAAGTMVLAAPIVTLFYGAALTPAVPALQILVLFLPFSFVNGLIQYVLIALGRQRQITVGYTIGCVFNVVANVLAIHAFSYLGAAAVTVASELVLLVPFYALLRRDLGSLPWGRIFIRPAIAAMVMAGAVALCGGRLGIAIPVGVSTYACAIFLSGSVTRADVTWIRAQLEDERRTRADEMVGRSNTESVGAWQ